MHSFLFSPFCECYGATIVDFFFPLLMNNLSFHKVEVQYFHDHGSLASVVGFKQNPIVDLSATVGAHGFAFGAAVGFDTAVGNFNKYSAAIGLTKPDYNVSFIL